MVRVFIKGGVWKNSEDEILKAAVMKYGKQQWARVASLLNRKSAKQCKARWNEWLDPSIRKIEWSREEDEKLLHLAKLMPAQWKTIGPLVGGRTSVQCQERYEQLLDEAANAAGGDGDLKMSGADGEEGSASSSSKKLRAGDIDPHPETKPARPDPIDMDEDEIEMLQEARARLANTQGKKAKRKAREKMLNEAKRLADLQKRRELKQAGLLSSAARSKASGKRRRKEIDLGVEIPFHKPAPAGFHSTADEDERADERRRKRMKDIDFKKINEQQYRARDRDEKNAQKKEEARLRALERSNMQYVVAQVSKKNDATAARKRGILSMPEPSITDNDLEKVAKLTKEQKGMADNAAMMMSENGAGAATDTLLGDYTDRPLPTPMRTPMSRSGTSSHEVIMREASNLRMLETGQTPLLGESNPMLMEGGAGTGVGLKNDGENSRFPGNATPLVSGSATPMTSSGKSVSERDMNQTPMTSRGQRDELGLNRPSSQMRPGMIGGDDISVSGTSFATSIGDRTMTIKEMARAERRAAKRARKELQMALASLPAPQFEYELAAPEAVTDDDDRGGFNVNKAAFVKDAADIEAEEIAKLEKEAAKLYEERSSVVKRIELPRPAGAVKDELLLTLDQDQNDSLQSAQNLIKEELLQLLKHDAFSHPALQLGGDSGKKKKKAKKGKSKTDVPVPMATPLEYINADALNSASELLNNEYETVIQEKRQLALDMKVSFQTDSNLMKVLNNECIRANLFNASQQFFSSQNGWSNIAPNITIDSLRSHHEVLVELMKESRKRCDKLEAKLAIKTGGYIKRSNTLNESTLQKFAEMQHSKIEERVYTSLMSHEKKGMTSRIHGLKDEIEILETAESVQQKKYGDLIHEKNRQLLLKRQKQKA